MAFRRKSHGKRPLRQVQWYDSILADTVPAVSQIGIDLTQNLPVQNLKGTTVTRILVDFRIRHGVTAVGNALAWGITLVDEDALTAAALPDANEESEQPGWLFRGAQNFRVSDVNDYTQEVAIKQDLKGQRKFAGNSSRLVLLVSNGGANAVFLNGMIRLLVKKP